MKLPSLKTLKKKADTLFSQYIRQRDADEGGTVSCVTCRKLMFWKESECGHWVKRQHFSVRWDERNAAPQCTRCNHFMGGCQDEFSKYIIDRYGVEVHNEILQRKHEIKQMKRSDYEEVIGKYKTALDCLTCKRWGENCQKCYEHR